MATNDLGIRFTEERYATKSEVIKALNTSLVDSIWSNILLYRTTYKRYTKLHDVSKSLFSICLCNSVKEKSEDLWQKFIRLNDRYSLLKDNTLEKHQINKPAYMEILREVARELNIEVNNVALDNIFSKRGVEDEYAPLVNYYNALLYIDSYNEDSIDDDLFAKLYSILNGGGELTFFYRTNDLVSYQSKALINREYEGLPARLIEDAMNNLFDFLSDDEIAFSIKLSIAYYMINYVKPFDKYNSLMSTLLVKYMLLRSGIAGATVIPFEHIFKEEENLKVVFKEVQKSRDLTYIVTRFNPLASNYAGELIDSLIRLNTAKIRDEYYGKDEEDDYVKPSTFVEEPTYEAKPTPAPVIEEPVIEEEPEVYEDEEVEEEVAPTPAPRVQVEPKVKKERKPYEHRMVKRETKVSSSANEQELIDMEEDMLESDPSLKSHQAHFYVRHCTVGKFYTIQQYKRLEGCVYETARTSMDNLAKKGYYKREQIKNKFVYTPIKRD